jgi:hypothetical protein
MLLNQHTVNDRINYFTNLPALRRGAFAALDGVSSQPKELQYLGPLVATVAMAQTLNRDIHADVARVRRMLGDLEGAGTDHVQAIRDYTKGGME